MNSDYDLAVRSARILGRSSAARQAIDEYVDRRIKGDDVAIWLIGNTWVVGPDPYSPAEPKNP